MPAAFKGLSSTQAAERRPICASGNANYTQSPKYKLPGADLTLDRLRWALWTSARLSIDSGTFAIGSTRPIDAVKKLQTFHCCVIRAPRTVRPPRFLDS